MLTYVDKFVTMLKHVAKRGNKKTSTLTTKQQCDPENSKRRENYSEKSEENTNQKAKKATVNTETERKSQKRASLREVEGLR